MLNENDLTQIRDYVIRILPELLRQEPEIATTIEGILAQHFPRRDEFARMLDEMDKLRADMDQRFDLLRDEIHQQAAVLREEMNQRIDLLRKEMNQRFEQVDQRFEQVDQRFEQMHQTQLSMKRDIVQLRQGQEGILKRLDGQQKWLQLVIGDLRREKGHPLEDMFAVALQYGLKNPDITPERIRLRQKLVDKKGQVFPAGFKTEVDLIAEDSTLIVFEVKATAKPSDVDFFSLKVRLVANQHPDKQVKGMFISLGAPPQIRQRCAQYGLQFVE